MQGVHAAWLRRRLEDHDATLPVEDDGDEADGGRQGPRGGTTHRHEEAPPQRQRHHEAAGDAHGEDECVGCGRNGHEALSSLSREHDMRQVIVSVSALLMLLGGCGRNDAADAESDVASVDLGGGDLGAADDAPLDPGTSEEPSEESADDASSEDGDMDVGLDCLEPRADNPFLDCPDFSDCEPRVCDTGGRTWDDLWTEEKAFINSHPPCTPVPAELRCMLKTSLQGSDWPDDAERVISTTAASAGGLLSDQVRALRCLAFREPSYEFFAQSNPGGDGIPAEVRPNLELDLGTSGEAAAAEFLARYGALLGALFHITPGYSFDAVELPLSWMLILRIWARTYQGFPFAQAVYVEIWLTPVTYRDSGSGEELTCPGKYVLEWAYSGTSRWIEDEDLDPAHAIASDEAIARALEACGASCSHPPPSGWTAAPELVFWTSSQLAWRVHLSCPSHCPTFPDWVCEYILDAHTGDMVSGGEECCVDC